MAIARFIASKSARLPTLIDPRVMLVDLDGTFRKIQKGRDVGLLIKAVIAMARDIATAVDSVGLFRQAEEALAQVEE